MVLDHQAKDFFSDRGKDLKNKPMIEFSQHLGSRSCLTACHSSFSNGSMERNHYTVDLTILNLIKEDKEMNIEDALRKALCAYNNQIRKSGFSPNQIVYGKQSPLPGIVDGNPANYEPLEKETIKNK